MTEIQAHAIQVGDVIEIPAGVDPRRKAAYRMQIQAIEIEADPKAASFISGTVITKSGTATRRSNFGPERWTRVILADCNLIGCAAEAIDEHRRQVEWSSGAAVFGER